MIADRGLSAKRTLHRDRQRLRLGNFSCLPILVARLGEGGWCAWRPTCAARLTSLVTHYYVRPVAHQLPNGAPLALTTIGGGTAPTLMPVAGRGPVCVTDKARADYR